LTYQTALALTVNFGQHKGKTLQEIWKTDIGYISYLAGCDNERIKEAIAIINAELKKAKEK